MARINLKSIIIVLFLFILWGGLLSADESGTPLILQEMSWKDVKDYLKTNDMVIIPLGSTEQHGPHLPLGTDYYESMGISKLISARTGVIVAPVLLAGYSVYHSGFPGSLSLKPETMENVLFETAEILIKYGFQRIMFFNYHGGNRVVESKVIHRINQTTEAVAVSIGIGAPFQIEEPESAPFDQHAGVGETSLMLYLKPDLVKMERAEKPKLTFTPRMERIMELGRTYPPLMAVLGAMIAVPEATNKGGASHELSNNGIWTLGDPRDASRELGEKRIKLRVDATVKFIENWKNVK